MAGMEVRRLPALMLPDGLGLKVGSTGPFAYLTAITAPSIAILPARFCASGNAMTRGSLTVAPGLTAWIAVG